jgi:hypothetical protein
MADIRRARLFILFDLLERITRDRVLMEHRFPKWLAYLVLGILFCLLFLGLYASNDPKMGHLSFGGAVLLGGIWIVLMLALALAFFWLLRYCVVVNDKEVKIRGCFRSKIIPLVTIAQIATVSAPRGGTDSYLFDKNDQKLTKLDGSLIGFDLLLADLEQRVRPFGVLVFRKRTLEPWQYRVAGDSHWVTGEIPGYTRKNGRRANYILIFGYVLIAAFAAASYWLDHGGFDVLLGQ